MASIKIDETFQAPLRRSSVDRNPKVDGSVAETVVARSF
jgi:hypothetical protein